MISVELKKRIISSFLIVCVVSMALFYLEGLFILPFFLMLGGTVLFEYLVIDEKILLRLTLFKIVLVGFLIYAFYTFTASDFPYSLGLLISYALFISLIIFYPSSLKKYKSAFMMSLFPLSFWAIIWIYYYTQINGPFYYLSFQAIASLPDLLGFCVGRIFPLKALQIPASPHKTAGGFLGAILLAPIVYQLLSYVLPIESFSFALLSFLTIGAIWGDLLFSGLKRLYDLKDFSAAIPGHGGLLDRIDSLIGVVFFYELVKTPLLG